MRQMNLGKYLVTTKKGKMMIKTAIVAIGLSLLICACGKPDTETQKRKAEAALEKVVKPMIPPMEEQIYKTLIIPPGYDIKKKSDGTWEIIKTK
jgi:hypothetical protein